MDFFWLEFRMPQNCKKNTSFTRSFPPKTPSVHQTKPPCLLLLDAVIRYGTKTVLPKGMWYMLPDGGDFCILYSICLFQISFGFQIKIFQLLGWPDPMPWGLFILQNDMFSLLTWLTRVKILHKQLQFWDHEKYKGWGGCILFAGP